MSLGSIDARAATYQAPAFAAKVPAGTTQVIRTVRTNRWCAKVYCTVTQAWVKSGGQWKIVTRWDGRAAVYRSSIGPNGFAAIGKRREGDGRTPSGVYTIKVTFSTTTTNPGAMPWKRRKPTSVVTNYNNHLYNTWIEERGRTDGAARPCATASGSATTTRACRSTSARRRCAAWEAGSSTTRRRSARSGRRRSRAPRSASPRRCAGSCAGSSRARQAAGRQQHLTDSAQPTMRLTPTRTSRTPSE